MKNSSFLLIFLLVSVMQFVFGYSISGKVIAVKDGDTIEILQDNKPYRLRLDGVDCPEKNQAYGQKAKEFTSNLCFGHTVRAEISENDKYGRFISRVFLSDGRILNEELLKSGYAWHYKEYNKERRLADMEDQARYKKIGLWADKDPVPPWNFRKNINSSDKPVAAVNGNFVGSANSSKFHTMSCEWGKKISKNNAIYFKTREDAVRNGYKPCKSCKP